MKNRKIWVFGLLMVLNIFACGNAPFEGSKHTGTTYLQLSMQLMELAKKGETADSIVQQLAIVSPEKLSAELHTDERKKAFWINIYNAYIQVFLRKNPELYEKRGQFFSAKRMSIAGKKLSFDDVEHGIIRGSRAKYTLGLTKKIFVSSYERRFRVQKRDGRIHFALNCGAKSCPPVAIYDAARIDKQLDKGAKMFLEKTSTYDEKNNSVAVTSLFSWFRGDFGWKRGIRKNYLQKYGIIPKDSRPRLQFTTYDWTIDLENFVEI